MAPAVRNTAQPWWRRTSTNTSYVLPPGVGIPLTGSNNFTERELHVQRSIAVTCALISVLSGIVTTYWFLRMKRSFRHDLIMLLIQSDMLKAFFFFIFPLTIFGGGPVTITSPFCQATGFFIAFGTEASDFAILMIAIHAALYIFRPTTSMGEAGLYEYRYYIYVAWGVFPLLMACLAWVGPDPAYVDVGTFCYLAVRPLWYRLALSWIPRYFIFILITVIYLSIYFYVRLTLSGGHVAPDTNKKAVKGQGKKGGEKETEKTGPVSVATSPPPRTASATEVDPETRQNSSVSKVAPQGMSGFNAETQPPAEAATGTAWEDYSFGTSAPIPNVAPEDETEFELLPNPSAGQPPPPRTNAAGRRASQAVSAHFSIDSQNVLHALRDNRLASLAPSYFRPGSEPSTADLPTRQNSQAPSSAPMIAPSATITDDEVPLRLTDSNDQPFVNPVLRQRQDTIKRQLRLIFIYPVVYMLMWVFPFVVHCMNYHDYRAAHPIPALVILSNVSVILQCVVTSCMFSVRERPWRHVQGHDSGSFWGSFLFWRHHLGAGGGDDGGGMAKGVKGGHQRSGKSRGEMQAEAKAAHARREHEKALARERLVAQASEANNRGPSMSARGGRGERSWWEADEERERNDSVLIDSPREKVVFKRESQMPEGAAGSGGDLTVGRRRGDSGDEGDGDGDGDDWGVD